jgi:hypothetical protein
MTFNIQKIEFNLLIKLKHYYRGHIDDLINKIDFKNKNILSICFSVMAVVKNSY